MAIREWAKLKDGERVPLERVLIAFDMFVLHGRKGDLDEVYSKERREGLRYPVNEDRFLLFSIELQSKSRQGTQNS